MLLIGPFTFMSSVCRMYIALVRCAYILAMYLYSPVHEIDNNENGVLIVSKRENGSMENVSVIAPI